VLCCVATGIPPQNVNPATSHYRDMFAVGVIMYTVLTGTHPFDRTNQASDSVIAQAIVQSAATATATAAAFDSDDTDTKKNVFDYLDKYVFDNRTHGLSSSTIMLMRSLLHVGLGGSRNYSCS